MRHREPILPYGYRQRPDLGEALDVGRLEPRLSQPIRMESRRTAQLIKDPPQGWRDEYAGEVMKDFPSLYYRFWSPADGRSVAWKSRRSDTERFEVTDLIWAVQGSPTGADSLITGEEKTDGSVLFNGVDDRINFSQTVQTLSGVYVGTFECLIKALDSAPATQQRPIFFYDSAAGVEPLGLLYRSASGLWISRVWIDGALREVTLGTPAAFAGAVHHVVIRFHSWGFTDTWVDGEQVGYTDLTVESAQQPTRNLQNGALGYNRVAGGEYFHGYLDEVAFYRHVLPESRLKRHAYVALGLV